MPLPGPLPVACLTLATLFLASSTGAQSLPDSNAWTGAFIDHEIGRIPLTLSVKGNKRRISSVAVGDSPVPLRDFDLQDGELVFRFASALSSGPAGKYFCKLTHDKGFAGFTGQCESKDKLNVLGIELEVEPVEDAPAASNAPSEKTQGNGPNKQKTGKNKDKNQDKEK